MLDFKSEQLRKQMDTKSNRAKMEIKLTQILFGIRHNINKLNIGA